MLLFFRIYRLVIFLACALLPQKQPGTGNGYIEVTVRGDKDLEPMPCRAWIESGETRYFTPETPATPYDRDFSFSCRGFFRIRVPAGEAAIHIERGLEFIPIIRKVVVKSGQTVEKEVLLERWVSMHEEGWYSSDMHVHFGSDDINILKELSLADDVNLVPAFTYWYHRLEDMEKKWPPWRHGGVVRADSLHVITLNNIEIERIGGEPFHSIGAPFFFNLDEPLYVAKGSYTYPSNTMLQRSAKELSPRCVIDTDKPLWAENVAGVALGLFDVVQICHNHYHREDNLRMGWGMIGAISGDEKELAGSREELFRRTLRIYYRWLNCGFRLGVSGGSAIGVMPVPLGCNRTYARVEGALTPAKYWRAVSKGRTFATSGPMITLTADDRCPGETVRLRSGDHARLEIRVRIRSIEKLDSVQIIQNGDVVHSQDLSSLDPSPVLDREFTAAVSPGRSGWLAARACYKTGKGFQRIAHTSPVYISVDGEDVASKEDAEYMIKWIDELLKLSQTPGRYPSDSQRDEVRAIFRKAREKYELIINKGDR